MDEMITITLPRLTMIQVIKAVRKEAIYVRKQADSRKFCPSPGKRDANKVHAPMLETAVSVIGNALDGDDSDSLEYRAVNFTKLVSEMNLDSQLPEDLDGDDIADLRDQIILDARKIIGDL